ncbi:MAG: Uma2 family endonuclease [Chloroflexota bacterium]
MTTMTKPVTLPVVEPTWAITQLFPMQGDWGEADYLALTEHTNRLIELVNGRLEVLPMPTRAHQRITKYLLLILEAIARRIGGEVHFAPLRVRIGPRHYREPDLLLVCAAEDPRNQNDYWFGADLVVEIISEGGYERDLVEKRREYAQVGIREYWIVDPLDETISVLTLHGDKYAEHGRFTRGATATSALLADLRVDVSATFDAK